MGVSTEGGGCVLYISNGSVYCIISKVYIYTSHERVDSDILPQSLDDSRIVTCHPRCINKIIHWPIT